MSVPGIRNKQTKKELLHTLITIVDKNVLNTKIQNKHGKFVFYSFLKFKHNLDSAPDVGLFYVYAITTEFT
jgi:hypothetical protein